MNTELITREVMEQYEFVRQSGAVDMFNQFGVQHVAERVGLEDLAEVAENYKDYKELLMNFQKYMAEYDIKQG